MLACADSWVTPICVMALLVVIGFIYLSRRLTRAIKAQQEYEVRHRGTMEPYRVSCTTVDGKRGKFDHLKVRTIPLDPEDVINKAFLDSNVSVGSLPGRVYTCDGVLNDRVLLHILSTSKEGHFILPDGPAPHRGYVDGGLRIVRNNSRCAAQLNLQLSSPSGSCLPRIDLRPFSTLVLVWCGLSWSIMTSGGFSIPTL